MHGYVKSIRREIVSINHILLRRHFLYIRDKIIIKFGEIQCLCVFAYIFIQNIVFKCNFTVLTFYITTLYCVIVQEKNQLV